MPITPIVVPPSQDFDGNDGPWSSFAIQVGSPPQVVEVLIFTAGYQTLVIIPEGCNNTNFANCSFLRGGLFTSNGSATWNLYDRGSSKGLFATLLESDLGFATNARYGYDTVALGW